VVESGREGRVRGQHVCPKVSFELGGVK